MPQMAPISWLILFTIFFFSFMMFNFMNFFSFLNKKFLTEKKNFSNMNINSLNWKW